MLKQILSICLLISSIYLFSNCGGGTKAEAKISFKNLTFTGKNAEFGVASIRTNIKLNVDSLLKANKANKIAKVTFNNLSFEVEGAENFDAISSVTLQLIGKDVKNISVASTSNIKKGTKTLNLTLSEKANATEFFQKGEFEALLDINMKDDSSEEKIILKGSFDCTLSLQ
jgi:hypothetical protein